MANQSPKRRPRRENKPTSSMRKITDKGKQRIKRKTPAGRESATGGPNAGGAGGFHATAGRERGVRGRVYAHLG